MNIQDGVIGQAVKYIEELYDYPAMYGVITDEDPNFSYEVQISSLEVPTVRIIAHVYVEDDGELYISEA